MIKRKTKEYEKISVEPESIAEMLDFDFLFGRSAPVQMEVGSGKGTFLLEEAKAFPEKNFFGIEWANKYYKYAVDRIGRWGIRNVRLMRTDAAIFIAEKVPDASIGVFHLYYPDPWPKKRHNKRRFFCDQNLIQLLRILKPNGIINIATDHSDYFEQMTEIAGRAIEKGLVKEIDFIRPAGAREGEMVGTNYERKYIKEGAQYLYDGPAEAMSHSQINLDILHSILDKYRDEFARFSDLLISENQKYNLTRIDSPEQIKFRHFIDSLAGLSILDKLSDEMDKPLKILDIGSGAGFPGLVLAIARPQWRVVSLEATAKKTNYQTMVCEHLELNNVTVINERAESLAHNEKYREKFDIVTSRALAAMPILAELSLGFVNIGGAALYWKGSSVMEEINTAKGAVEQMGAEIETVFSYTLQTGESEPVKLSLVECKKRKQTPKQYPRVFGIIKKKPLS